MKKFAAMATVVAMSISTSFAATTLPINDDFESYANNAALTTAYDVNTITGLVTTQAHSGTKSVANPHANASGAALNQSWPGVNSSVAESLIVEYWLYDSAGSGPGATGSATLNGRGGLTLGAYSGGTYGSGTLENLLAFATYHATSTSNYVTRVLYGPSAGYAAAAAPRTVGWQQLRMEIGTYYDPTLVRFFHNGNLALTGSQFTQPASGWNCLRLGSLAGTTYVDLWYDDLSVVFGPSVPVTTSGIWID